jgi:hypothetical protein
MIDMRTFIALFSMLVVSTTALCSQPFVTIKEYETAIQQSFEKALTAMADSQKINLNKGIEELFASALALPGAFSYPFDSLNRVGRIISRDEKARIFTWDLVRNDGSHQYSGIILYLPKNAAKPFLFPLTDCSGATNDPVMHVLGPETWFGALYYDIIERKWNDHILYTLLGFDPNDIFTSRKIIDCFYMKDDTIAVFGAPVFLLNNKIQYRVVFEYSAKVSMSMQYNESTKMIVFDHLSPARPSYTGSYQFYGPDFSYDAFKFVDGQWVLFEDVDVRNR